MEIFAEIAHLRIYLGGELAIVAALDLGEPVRIGNDCIRKLAKNASTLRRTEMRPALKCLFGARNGRIDIRPPAARNLRPHLACIGVVSIEIFSGGGFALRAVDV